VATRIFDRRPAPALTGPHERIAAIVGGHGDLLLRVARGYSLCADDAHDAVQRALEIYMRRAESLDPATELAWLKVVVKHEALAVRRGRAGVAGEDVDLDAVPAVAQRTVEERLESNERVERSAEVMRRLKRDEARALMLKAEGLSYNEIGERLGWTYTKVNRCITEGRRRFMKLYAELETGAECERLAPVVAALAAGTATPEALLELRPHLRNCTGCRATVRTLHASRLPRLTAFAPIAALVAPARAFVERLRGGGDEPPAEPLHPMEGQQELEEAFRRLDDGGHALHPAVSSAAEGVGRASQVRLNTRAWLEGALQRLQSSDVAVGIHTIGASGGGRITSIAALIGVCVSGVGAGTYCVATALLPDPKPAAVRTQAAKPAKPRKHKTRRIHLPAHTRRVVAATPRATPSATVRPTRTATATARPQPAGSPARTSSPSANRQPARAAPPAPAGEFSFEAGSASTASTSPSGSGSTGRSGSSASSSRTGAAPTSTQAGGEPSNDGGDEFSP
jgi:RNA polymerase sigma factor (sigma-70 family)